MSARAMPVVALSACLLRVCRVVQSGVCASEMPVISHAALLLCANCGAALRVK